MLSKLTKLSEEYNVCLNMPKDADLTSCHSQIAILLTNQVQCIVNLWYRFFSLTSYAQLTLAQRWHLSQEERWNPSEATSSLTRPLQECFFEKVSSQCSWELLLVIIPSLGRAEERVVKLVDSPDRPESEASYKLDEGGWADVWEPMLTVEELKQQSFCVDNKPGILFRIFIP